MFRHELAVEQGEVAGLEPCYEPGERDFRGVAGAAEHALAEEGAAELYAVKAADELAALPDLDRVGVAGPVQRQHRLFELGVDPCLLAFGAGCDHFSKIEIMRDFEPAGAKRAPERTR
jgi:hypothetical protein